MPPLNILLLQGEDLGRHLGCYGDPCARTPNLDQLASEGVRYTNAFTHAPVCAPSRGGMISGCYPWSIGNHHMRTTLCTPPRCFTEDLRAAGYFVNWPTKLDFNFDPAEGWRDEQSHWWEHPAPRQPFLLYQNFHITHESHMFPDIPSWHSLPDCASNLTPTDPDDVQVPPYLCDSPELRAQLVRYYDAVAAVDAEVGARLRWLDEQGLRDNTLVIFLSDHGRGLPREKRWCYDAGLHLPLILRHPGRLAPGSICDDLVAWVDLAPSLLSLAGHPVPERLQGQVFLGENAAAPRECVFAGRDRMDEVYDRVRVVRDKHWHYIRNFEPTLPWSQRQSYMEEQPIVGLMRARHARGLLGEDEALFFQPGKPEEELYDALADPHMLHNRADDPALAHILQQMRERLAALRRRFGDLAETSEEDLIEQGILSDRLPEYRARILPESPVFLTLRERCG